MSFADVTTYCFNAEWFSPQAEMTNKYELTLFVPKKAGQPVEVAIFDIKARRIFLKRTPQPDLRLEDFHLGGTVTIHARQMKLTSYLDERTRNAIEGTRESFSALTAPQAFPRLGSILSAIEGAGLVVTKLRLVNDGGPVVALQVVGKGAAAKWESAAGSLSEGDLSRVPDDEAAQYFDDKSRFPCTAVFESCTLGVVRPHAVKAGCCGEIVAAIVGAGFEISAMKMVHLSRAHATEAFEVYKGVLPHYAAIVEEMSGAPCLVMELRKAGRVVEDFRTLCGPLDVEMANHLRPQSLRARFGKDLVQNAVHATDLEGDAEMEVRYFFELLD
jgi:nucleoside-diphosphate kinase